MQKHRFVGVVLCGALAFGSARADESTDESGELDLFRLNDALREYATTGGSNSALELPDTVSVVTAADLTARGAANITEGLRGMPGVNVSAITASQPLVGIRGGNPFDSQRVALLVDGLPINLDFFGVKTYTQLPLAMVDIDRIEVLRNPATLYGANAIAGAINVVTRKPVSNELRGKLSLGEQKYRTASASASGLLDRGFYRLSAEYLRTNQFGDRYGLDGAGPALKEPTPSDAARNAMLIDNHFTATVRVEEKFGKHRLEATGAFTSFRGGLRFPDRMCEQDLALQGIVVGLGDEISFGAADEKGRQATLLTRVSFNQSKADFLGSREIARFGIYPNTKMPAPGAQTHGFVRNEWGLNSQFNTSFLRALEGQFVSGLELQYTSTTTDNMFISDLSRFYGGLYLLPSIQLAPGLRVFAGGRIDVGLSGAVIPSPTASAVYQITEHQAVRAVFASGGRSPNTYELKLAVPFIEDVSAGKRGSYFGNSGLQPERLTQVDLGYQWVSARVKGSANVFYSSLTQFIEMVEVSNQRIADRGFEDHVRSELGYVPTLPYLEYSNQGNVNTFGGELALEVQPVTGLTVKGSYTLLKSRATVTSDPALVIRRISAADRNAPTHAFSIGGSYVWQGDLFKGASASVYFDFTDQTSAFVSGVLKTIPAWNVLTARISVPVTEVADIAFEAFNLLDSSHFEWPRHNVGRRMSGTLIIHL